MNGSRFRTNRHVDIGEQIADLHQEAGNLDIPRQNDAQVEAVLRAFLTERILPVLMQK